MSWIVLANSSHYCIYDFHQKPCDLTLLKENQHDESRLKQIDLSSDRPGRYKTSTSTKGTYESRVDPKENEIDHFIHELAVELETGRTSNNYDELVLIAPPHISGILSKHLNKNIKRLIVGNEKKDYTNMPKKELLTHLQEHWKEITA